MYSRTKFGPQNFTGEFIEGGVPKFHCEVVGGGGKCVVAVLRRVFFFFGRIFGFWIDATKVGISPLSRLHHVIPRHAACPCVRS